MILTSRSARPNRNFMFKLEEGVANRYRQMVARELQEWIGAGDLQSIKHTPREKLIILHSSLGTAIRNEYELWMPEHEVTAIYGAAAAEFPLKAGEIDDHPCHPDNFSFSCIEQLWENLQ